MGIARCPNVARCFETDASHPCERIVASQCAASLDEFQTPEPWVGRIDVAPILFIASNPSIGKDTHALWSSDNEAVWESHHLAFGGGSRRYIQDGIRTTGPDGSPIKAVRYWSGVRARARELIVHREVRPGIDYAMSEVVHCKSRGEIGVREALDTCLTRHFDNLMSVSPAVVVLTMGSVARASLELQHFGAVERRVVAGRLRYLVALPHPTGRVGPKTLTGSVSPEELAELRRAVLLSA